ncbi:MAG TPA: hypothetical protein VN682_08915 [Terriglobales bacterium]|jgi:hypothetical protein|nr:hypothetical protein [Terriglobales bacterium]
MSSPRLLMALWISQTIIQIAIAAILYRRKLNKEFPAFFTYIVAQVVIFCVQLPVFEFGGATLYFDAYWVGAALNIFLAFRIIHEIFLDVFKPYHALKDLGAALFKWAAIIMVLLSVALIMVSPSWEDPVRTSILIVQRCVRVVQCGLVIFLLAFSSTLAVSWRRLSFGIALGFGIFSASELLTTALFSGGRIRTPTVQLAAMTTYIVGMLVWLFYGLVNRRREMVPVLVPQRWDEALMEIQPAEAEGDSLIPMFEHMVDQALSKTGNSQA